MTDDPKRWLSDGSDASNLERELLGSMRDVRPPAHAREQAWRGIAASLAAGAVATSVAPAAASSTAAKTGVLATSTLLTKAIVTLAASGIAVGGYFAAQQAFEPPAAQPRERAAEVVPAARAKQVEPTPSVEANEIVQPEALEPNALKLAPRNSERKRKDLLIAESALLTRARAALRAGDPSGAQRLIDRMTSEFPGGVLEQEREVLAIEVVAARGDTAAAKQRTMSFAKRYPSSPHTTRLRPLLDAP